MRTVNELIIHCADTPDGSTRYGVRDVTRWHTDPKPKGKGWTHIGYHWVIHTDGTIHRGRPKEQAGSHAAGHNSNSFGVCLMGRTRFTPQQWASLKALVHTKMDDYGIPPNGVRGHNDVDWRHPPKSCPGFDVQQWMDGGMIPKLINIYTEQDNE
jgi:N-acetyl-anhydromuramyl-L-alanine amidase AmpD